MRLTFVVRSLAMGGAERQLAHVATGLVRRGHQVTIVTLYDGGQLETPVRDGGVRLLSARKRRKWDLGFLLRLRLHCRDSDPDVLCGWMPFENLLCLLCARLGRRRPVAWALRASNLDLRNYDFATRLIYRLQRALIRIPQLVLSNSIAGLVAQGLAPGQAATALVDNVVDSIRFAPDQVLRTATRAELGIPDSNPLVGIVGRLDPMKDHATFLRAAKLVASRVPESRFVIVGSGPAAYADGLRSLAEALGIADRILWIPRVPDTAAILNAVDVLVSTSSYGEGSQNVLLEAIACGTPVVATDVGDARRILTSFDFVVAPGDVEGVSNAILASAERAGAENRAFRRMHAMGRFNLDNAVTQAEAALIRASEARGNCDPASRSLL